MLKGYLLVPSFDAAPVWSYPKRKQQCCVYVQLEVQSMSTAETSGDMALASHMEVVKDGFIATGPTTVHV